MRLTLKTREASEQCTITLPLQVRQGCPMGVFHRTESNARSVPLRSRSASLVSSCGLRWCFRYGGEWLQLTVNPRACLQTPMLQPYESSGDQPHGTLIG